MVQRLLAVAPTSVFQTFLATINFHTSIPPYLVLRRNPPYYSPFKASTFT
jgi:hypothetical protein